MQTNLTTPPNGIWSGRQPIPAIGAKVTVALNNLGAGTVQSYFLQAGYVGVAVVLDAPPAWRTEQLQRAGKPTDLPAMVFGAELAHQVEVPAWGQLTRKRVTSSNIASVGHHAASSVLEIEFKNGGVYRYHAVSEALFLALMVAPSVGKFLNERIKPTFKCEKQPELARG